jgi:hypothetical protein
MKTTILSLLIAISLFSFSCKNAEVKEAIKHIDSIDAVNKINNQKRDVFFDSIVHIEDSLFIVMKLDISKLKKQNDSLKTALFRANLKITRVNYYRKITNKNPKKFNVFFRGWINGLFENQ